MSPRRAELNKLISYLVPAEQAITRSILAERGSSQSLYLPIPDNENIMLGKNKITALQMLCHHIHDLDGVDGYLACRVILTIKGGRHVYAYSANDPMVKVMYRLLYGVLQRFPLRLESAFSTPQLLAQPWMWSKGIAHAYSMSEKDFYAAARKLLADALDEFLLGKQSEFKNQFPRDEKTPAKIISLGCGEGADLITTIKKLQKHMRFTKAVGIDISSVNVAIAQQKHRQNVATFLNKKISELAEVYQQYLRQERGLTIAIAVGTLTRMIHDGSLAVMAILQEALAFCDVIAITGITDPLVTLEMAKSIGWQAQLENYKLGYAGQAKPTSTATIHSIYILSRPTEVEMAQLLRARFSAGELELSCSGNPLLHLQLFAALFPKQAAQVANLRLDYALLSDADINHALAVQLAKFTALKNIFYNHKNDIALAGYTFTRVEKFVHNTPYYLGDTRRVLEKSEKLAQQYCFFSVGKYNLAAVKRLANVISGRELMVTDNAHYDLRLHDSKLADARLPQRYEPTVHLKLSWLRMLGDKVDEVAEVCGVGVGELRRKL